MFKPVKTIDMTPEEQEKQLVYNHLEEIKKSARKILKAWETKLIPFPTLKVILDNAKRSENTGSKENDAHFIAFNRCLTSLYIECENWAKELGLKGVPMGALDKGIDVIKSGYK